MAKLRKADLDRALKKASGAADKKALRGGYSAVQARVNAILQAHGLFLPWAQRREMIANIRAGHTSFEFLRDRADRLWADQRTRILEKNKGTAYDNDLVAIRNGLTGVKNRIRYMYTSRGLPYEEADILSQAKAVLTGSKTIEQYRTHVQKVYTELHPEDAVDDIAEDVSDAEAEAYDMARAVQAMFPFLQPELVEAYVQGWEDTGDPEQAIAAMRNDASYDRYFPGNRLGPGQFALTEADYMSYATQARDLMQEYGLPAEYFDRDEDIGRLVGGQVRLSQLEERIRKGYVAALNAPDEVRDELSRSFGFGIGDLAAFWLDPTKGEDLLQRKFTEAQIRGASRTSGYGDLNIEDSELLADYGISGDEARQGFGALVQGRGLFEGLVGTSEEDISLQDQLGATFLGDAEQRDRIRRRAQSRIAAFQGGGGGAESQEGNLGLRDSDQ